MMGREEMTVLYSTHILDDLHRLADDVVFLHDGRVRLSASKDELIDRWRRIRFGLDRELSDLAGVVEANRVGPEFEVISNDGQSTMDALSNVGATGVRAQSLTLEEIAVNIMKGNGDVSYRPR
jgi:ABC-2 type transport system ATP-binding protein